MAEQPLETELIADPRSATRIEAATDDRAATAALVLGGCSILLAFFAGLPAVIIGAISLRRASRSGRVRALVGMGLGASFSVVWMAVIFFGFFLQAPLSAESPSLASSSGSKPLAAAEKQADAAIVTPAKPPLPPDPVPPVQGDADEVAQLHAALRSDKAYLALWTAANKNDIDVFLTAVSELLASCNVEGKGELAQPFVTFLKQKHLNGAATFIFRVFARTGGLPRDFGERAEARIIERLDKEDRALWTKGKPDSTHAVVDQTALAVLLSRKSPGVLRERISAKRDGQIRWTRRKATPYLPYLADERAALARLALLTDLTPAEKQRLTFLDLPRPGDPIDLGRYRYIITGARTTSRIGNDFVSSEASEGAVFLIVDYTIENLGTRTATVLASDFFVLDKTGVQYDPSSEASTTLAMTGRSRDLLLSELHPGIKRKLTQVFEVPRSVTDGWFKLVIPEKGLMGTGQVEVALELE